MARQISPAVDRGRGSRIRNAFSKFFRGFGRNDVSPGPTEPTTLAGYKVDSPATRSLYLRSAGNGYFYDFFQSGGYIESVRELKKLTEWNPVFTALMNKVVKPVADIESRITIEGGNDGRHDSLVAELNKMIGRTEWNNWKDYHLRQMLNEGGLSIEVVLNKARQIVGLEYRPHYTIRPLYGKNRQFADPMRAYQQIDINSGDVLAVFPKWAIAEVNWQESSFHDRGVPYLVAARKTLEAVGAMINGLVQKWIRAGGEIELYSLKEAHRWEDVEDFQDINAEGLNPETDNLIRQIFAKGDVDVKRIHGDKLDGDGRAIELLLEIIFMSAGIPKEVMGFKGHLTVRNMASLSAQSYYSILHNVKKKIDRVLKRAVDLQILLMFDRYRVLPEDVPYTISGLDFLKDGVDFRINRAQKIVNLILGVAQLYDNPAEVLAKLNNVFQKEMSDFNLTFSDSGLKSSIEEVKPVKSPGGQEQGTKEESQ